jgi:Icc-related predicted phosphoesterase
VEFLVLADIHDTWVNMSKMLRLAGEMYGVIFLGDLMTFRKFTQTSIDNLTRLKEASSWMVGIPGNGPLPRVREFFDDIGINLHSKGRSIENIGFFGVGGIQETVTTISEIREFYRTEDTSSITPDDRAMDTLNSFGILYQNGKFVVEDWSENDLSALDVYISPFEHSEERIHEILSTAFAQIEDVPTKILLSHVPPHESGIVSAFPIGVSTGSKAITNFIAENPVALSLSGHYHKYHAFQIGPTNCIAVPAVMNGFYGVLSIDSSTMELSTEIHKF